MEFIISAEAVRKAMPFATKGDRGRDYLAAIKIEKDGYLVATDGTILIRRKYKLVSGEIPDGGVALIFHGAFRAGVKRELVRVKFDDGADFGIAEQGWNETSFKGEEPMVVTKPSRAYPNYQPIIDDALKLKENCDPWAAAYLPLNARLLLKTIKAFELGGEEPLVKVHWGQNEHGKILVTAANYDMTDHDTAVVVMPCTVLRWESNS